MSKTARITDIGVGICVCHIVPIPMTGVIITGAGNKKVENQLTARITDIVLGYCGHTGVIITGNSTLEVANQSQSRIGDDFTGCFNGVIMTGAGTSTTG